MRCLTLADCLHKNGASVVFITNPLAADCSQLIESKGHKVRELSIYSSAEFTSEKLSGDVLEWQRDAASTLGFLRELGRTDLLIVDHYALDDRWEQSLKSEVGKIMVIDDLANRKHDCNFLLDANFFERDSGRYDNILPSDCVIFTGPKYALLRSEFREILLKKPVVDREEFRIVISFGGSDPTGETLKVLKAVKKSSLQDVFIDVIVGAWNKQREQIELLCAEIPGATYFYNVNNMASLMAGATLYVGAGGTTTWERCCMSLPGIVIATAENQVPVSIAMAQKGAQIYLGQATEVTGNYVIESILFLKNNIWIRNSLAGVCGALVDGLGVERIVRRIVQRSIVLREAGAADSETLFQWRNALEVRRNSFNVDPIDWKAHADWYSATLLNPNRVLLIGMENNKAIGVLRYDLDNCKAVVSIYLAPGQHGKGYGEQLLAAGNEWMAAHYAHITTLEAEMRPDNEASTKIFERAGFGLKKMVFGRSQNNVN